MSEQDFDNRMRKKLDSLQEDYPPEAWNSFKKLLPAPWYLSFFRTYGGWIFGGISSLVLLLNIVTNTKDPEFEETNTIKHIKTPKIVKEIQTVTKLDTLVKYVYLTKYVDRLVTVGEKGSGLGDVKVESSGNSYSLKEDLVKDENSTEQVSPVNEELAELTDIETDKPKKILPKDTSSVGQQERMPEKKSSFWQKVNIRPGIETNFMGHKSFSYGTFAEIFLKNRFSLSTGVSISNSNPNTFNWANEFNKFTGKDFEDLYKPPKPSGSSQGNIKDITIETSRIRMPIYLTYYVPITYSLDFLINTGTRLDLKVSENVSYTNDALGNSPFRRFESAYKPKIFNNLYYGMGLQYKYGRIYGQFTPYFEFPFSKPKYLISSNKFGINAALKFSLK